ncbi:hypothetical protein FDC45_16980 [Clostridium botulinum]|uniref:Uncharacterized protein n=1 Tax=Clostridium botulinum TaxID=1491 RepID=A0A846J9X2_CLOBO|nr:hypothetical protein [Clostridium botulinum]ACA55687.1 hypothetical protein CLK_0724 [Clostridium botulinum A3 str. Loch Maree]NFH66567.1 hypothetical protein [Clostridium botulinum]NFJ10322.1 hypothetical protein [Clostridium botulinum]NFK15696.1 hypothetical protein [Clostridium botulinum]NFM95803.1 hypothetical protein [Clostridium botulinum]
MNNNKYFAENMNAVSTKVGSYTNQNMGQNNQQAGSQATSTNAPEATSTATSQAASTNASQATSTKTSAAYSNQNTKKS